LQIPDCSRQGRKAPTPVGAQTRVGKRGEVGRRGGGDFGFWILDSLFLIEEGARGGRVGRCPLKRSGLSGLGVTLLRS